MAKQLRGWVGGVSVLSSGVGWGTEWGCAWMATLPWASTGAGRSLGDHGTLYWWFLS